jgi:hypothetical protein
VVKVTAGICDSTWLTWTKTKDGWEVGGNSARADGDHVAILVLEECLGFCWSDEEYDREVAMNANTEEKSRE